MNRPYSTSRRFTAMRMVIAVVAISIVGTLVASRALAGMQGAAISQVMVQNLDMSRSATVIAQFQHRDGGDPVYNVRPGVPPGGTTSLPLFGENAIKRGLHAVSVTADRKVGFLLRTVWDGSGAVSTYEGAEPATELLVPLFRAQPLDGPDSSDSSGRLHDSIVDLQNLDSTRSTDAQLELRDPSGRIVARWTHSIGPGRSIGIDAASEPALADLPDRFVGSLYVSAESPLALSSSIDMPGSDKGVAAFQVAPVASSARRLHAPMIGSGPLESWIVVLNPAQQPNELELSYRGNDDASGSACGSGTILHGGRSWTIEGSGMTIFAQGVGGGSGLPQGCMGSATLVADRPLLAYVLVEDSGAGTSAAYLASAEVEAHPRVHLPLYRYQHTLDEMSTAVQVLNPGQEALDVSLLISRHDGTEIPCPGCQVRLNAGASWFWHPFTMKDLRDWPNSYGSARLEASGPVLALAYEFSGNATTDSSIYRGLSMTDGDDGPVVFSAGHAPFFSYAETVRTATPTPDPTRYRIYLPYLANVVHVGLAGTRGQQDHSTDRAGGTRTHTGGYPSGF